MRIRKTFFRFLLVVPLLLPSVASAQGVSINTFSPYSFFGIGDIAARGTASSRGMGGVGLGFRSPVSINTLNPASYSSIDRQTALFYVGLQGENRYLRSDATRNSHNSFNVNEISLQLPLAKGLGLTVAISPYSSVGYRIAGYDDSAASLEDIGYVHYLYSGAGGVSSYKLGVGYAITDWLSLGAQMIYYQGNITRNFQQTIIRVTGSGNYVDMTSDNQEHVSRVLADFGLQARLFSQGDKSLTLGAYYSLGGRLNSKVSEIITHAPSFSNVAYDTVLDHEYVSDFRMPHQFGGGLYYQGDKLSAGVDYRYSGWGVNGADSDFDVRYRDTHSVAAGIQFVPRAGDVRRILNRWAYRFGAGYDQYYMVIGGHTIDAIYVSLGLGIPLGTAGKNMIDIGLEFGTRGSAVAGMVRENYFRVSVGLTLFGNDFWFMKYKYD